MISIERSETAQKSTLETRDKFSPRQNAVQDKIQSENFFQTVRKFLLWTEFYLRLYLSWNEFCLGLNFVLDYIPQLYFVCNILIIYIPSLSSIWYRIITVTTCQVSTQEFRLWWFLCFSLLSFLLCYYFIHTPFPSAIWYRIITVITSQVSTQEFLRWSFIPSLLFLASCR